MKKVVALLICLTLILSGCAQTTTSSTEQTDATSTEVTESSAEQTMEIDDQIPEYASLDDENLLQCVEDLVYKETVESLDSDEYVVEGVSTKYISKEYLEELAYNSQENIYFGYTLSQLNEEFQGTRYVFTLDDNGKTTVQEFEDFDETTNEIIKNVAIGTGVILICVTVSTLTAGTAPAVSVIFAASADAATKMAAGSAAFGAVAAGITTGIQTKDMNEALKAAALGGSEGFKWGAISGAIAGGGQETFALKQATKNGLTMSQAALIQKESKLPMDVISQLHSVEEYNVYKEAGLKTAIVNGKTALIQDIDLEYVSELADGTKLTNLERMLKGLAPLDPSTGKAYQLHHIGQKADGTLAILTEAQHQGNSAILNIFGKASQINRKAFATTRAEFWKSLGNALL